MATLFIYKGNGKLYILEKSSSYYEAFGYQHSEYPFPNRLIKANRNKVAEVDIGSVFISVAEI